MTAVMGFKKKGTGLESVYSRIKEERGGLFLPPRSSF
jgi:hypothetical protein